jgi:hypothetical protein
MDDQPTPRAILAAAAAVLAALYLYSFLMPTDVADEGPQICVLKSATGVPCPLCGMSRAFIRASHGDLAGALGMHPLVPLLYVGGLLLLVALVAGLAGSRRLSFVLAVNPLRAVWVTVAVFGVFWAVRILLLWRDGSLAAAFRASPAGRLLGG